MNAFKRGMELLGTKGRDVPLLALRYQKALCSQLGMCGEVLLTALCWYAETEEKLAPSPDDNYAVHNDDVTTMEVIFAARIDTWKPEWWNEINGETE